MVKLKNLFRFLSGAQNRNVDSSLSSGDACVRIIHAGGREELYRSQIPASQLMNKYPGMRVARPQVFMKPHESILVPGESLLLGQKYYMIPSTTVKKLTRKVRKSAGNGSFSEHMPEENSSEYTKEGQFSNHETGIRCFLRKKGMGKKKPFVPPIPTERACRSIGWEPSLTSVQELSP